MPKALRTVKTDSVFFIIAMTWHPEGNVIESVSELG